MTTALGINNVFSATLEAVDVTALGEDGSDTNYGLSNYSGAAATLRGGSFTARGGKYTRGIASGFMGARLETAGVTVLAENGSSDNTGLINYSLATATLHGGSFTGRGGENAFGIGSHDSGTTLDAESVTALAENGSGSNQGLVNDGGAAATLRTCAFTGRGGTIAYGINNSGSGTTLEAESVTALGEDGNSNWGLLSLDLAVATLRGGSFTARGGTNAYGIANNVDTTLEAESATALGENGSDENFGLYNENGAAATLRGGSFTGRRGTYAYGILNEDSDTTLIAESVAALGENGSNLNRGLFNIDGAEATLHGGSFTGRGGTSAFGITNELNVTLAAERVTALGTDGISTNYGLHNDNSATATANSSQFIGSSNGLYQESGTVHLGVSQLDGGATRTSGTLTCFQVYDGSYAAYSCP
jgi:hypothetical protein